MRSRAAPRARLNGRTVIVNPLPQTRRAQDAGRMTTPENITDGEAQPVVTRSNRGQWETHVEGHPELSSSSSSREEAIDAGRTVADQLGVRHVVEDAEPTGAITDEAGD